MSDPTWLPDVLRAAGLIVDVYPGAMDRGHGDMGELWGVIVHHTGASGSPGPSVIANHPDLGLAAQLHLARDGRITVCGVGIAWHAGEGSYPGLPTNNANPVTIGIECENNGTEGWGPAQYNALVGATAAILRKIGQPASHAIGHKEWAGAAQGKWDPGRMDMATFRTDVQTALDKGVPPVATEPTYQSLVVENGKRSEFRAPLSTYALILDARTYAWEKVLFPALLDRITDLQTQVSELRKAIGK